MIWRIVRPPQVATSAVSRLVPPTCRARRASLTYSPAGARRLSLFSCRGRSRASLFIAAAEGAGGRARVGKPDGHLELLKKHGTI